MRVPDAPSRMHRKRKRRRTAPQAASRTLRRSFLLRHETERSPEEARRLRPALCFWPPHRVRRNRSQKLCCAPEALGAFSLPAPASISVRARPWPAKVGRQDQSPTFLNRQPQRRQRLANARVIADHAILERNIEVHANEHALAAQIEIIDRQLVHAVLGKLSDDAAGVPR